MRLPHPMVTRPARRLSRILRDLDRTVLKFSLARVTDAMAQSAVIIAIPIHAAQIQTGADTLSTVTLAGILLSTFAITNTATQPLAGALGDRSGRRKPWVQLGILMMSAGTLALAFAWTPAFLILLQIIRGIGCGLTNPSSLLIVSGGDSQSRRGGSIGLFFTIRAFGFASGPIVGGLLLDLFGLQSTYLVTALLSVASAILIQRMHKEIRAVSRQVDTAPFRFFDRSMLDSRILAVGLTLSLMIVGMGLLLPLLNEFADRLQQSALGIASAFSATLFAGVLLQNPIGRLSDRIGRIPPIVVGLLLMAPATALQGYVGTITHLVILRTIQGVAMALVMSPAFALVADLSTAGVEGRQLSVATMGVDFGASMAPLITGFFGVYILELPFLIGGGMSLAGVGIILLVHLLGAPTLQKRPMAKRSL